MRRTTGGTVLAGAAGRRAGASTSAPAPAPTTTRKPLPLRHALVPALFVAPASMGISGPSLVLPEAARALGVSPGAAAWLMTVTGIGMALGTPLLSATAGRRGPGGTARAGAVLLILGASLVLLAGIAGTAGLPLALAGRAVEAVGAAGVTVTAFRLAALDRSGRAAAIVAIGSAAGGTLGLFAGAAAGHAAGWRAALVLPLLSLLALPAVLRRTGPAGRVGHTGPAGPAGHTAPSAPAGPAGPVSHTGPTGPASPLAPARPLALLRAPAFLAAAGLMLVLSTVNFALLYGAPRRVAALTGWSPVHTGAVAGLAALTGALLSWRLVRLAPRLGARRTRALLAAASAAALPLAALAPWPAAVLLGSGLSALATAGGQGTLLAAALRGLAEDRHGTAVGLFNLAFLSGVALGPALAATATAAALG
ncbi:MFS transporter [Streptomyces sp. NPDC048659]|uniref:MFS transporter n=1 Tax=Streptomyces sp. NPDC048659 TaxID=3155489 RepID=UPI00343D9CC8